MMDEHAFKARLDSSLSDLHFTSVMRAEVRARITAAPPTRTPFLHRGLALALACAALLMTALAVAPAVWDLIRAHLGPSASYAAPIGQATIDIDEGMELKTVAALTDRNTVRLYFTLRDLDGDRLSEGAKLDLWPLTRDETGQLLQDENAPNGGTPMEQVGYDAETRTLTLCKTFYSASPQAALNLSVREIVPGNRDYCLQFTEDDLSALVKEAPLDSTLDENGNRYLLPNQNPRSMDWEQCPLPPGTKPGVSVSSVGFAEDGRFHIRLQVAVGNVLTRVLLPDYQGLPMEQTAVLEDGVDYAFPEGGPGPADLSSIPFFYLSGEYSAQGGALQGVWDLEVPLTPVESLPLSWPGGPLSSSDGTPVTVEGLWLSPLGLSLDCRTQGGSSFLWVDEAPIVTYTDGSHLPVQTGALIFSQEQSHSAVERLFWALQTPTDLSKIASVTLWGQTLRIP